MKTQNPFVLLSALAAILSSCTKNETGYTSKILNPPLTVSIENIQSQPYHSLDIDADGKEDCKIGLIRDTGYWPTDSTLNNWDTIPYIATIIEGNLRFKIFSSGDYTNSFNLGESTPLYRSQDFLYWDNASVIAAYTTKPAYKDSFNGGLFGEHYIAFTLEKGSNFNRYYGWMRIEVANDASWLKVISYALNNQKEQPAEIGSW